MNKPQLPYYDEFVTSEEWVRKTLRKGLNKKSRDFYYIKNVDRLSDGKYLIRLEKEFKI